MSSPKGQTIDLATLSSQQLSQVKKQLDDELEHLTSSFTQLRAAQAKFRECLRSIASGVTPKVGGVLADNENVIVDVGTGFYVEKSTNDATTFYEAKVKELEANLKDLESIVQGKSNNLRIVEDVLRQKVLSSGTAAGAA